MNDGAPRQLTRGRETVALVVFLALCLAVSGIGGAVTATSVGTWYQGLQKPPFNPPDWIFAPVWTMLYVFMAVAAWRVWRRAGLRDGRSALLMFAVQLALNLAWSILFFGLRLVGVALFEIVILLFAIVVTSVLFWRLDRPAGALMLPYAAWVAFACVLNASLWLLN